jgi:hypothetical protein
MKRRRPWLYYLLGLLSGGVFWIAWTFLMARDVNAASKGDVPRLGALTVVYCGVFTFISDSSHIKCIALRPIP